MKERLKQNIDHYEQEIKLKEEISLREVRNLILAWKIQKENINKEIQTQNEEIDKIKRENALKEKQLQEKIKQFEKVNLLKS